MEGELRPPPSAKKRPIALTTEQKLEILEALKTSKQQSVVAKEFGLDKSTISKIKSKEEQIRRDATNNENLKRKRKRKSPNEDVAEALVDWFHRAKTQNDVPINGPMMMEKARELALQLGRDNFHPSSGWLQRLKMRHNIRFSKVVEGDEILQVPNMIASQSNSCPVSPQREDNNNNNSPKKRSSLDDAVLSFRGVPTEDKFDIIGKNVAAKLRSLPNDQRIYAEKIINEVLFEAELNNLNRNCYVAMQVLTV